MSFEIILTENSSRAYDFKNEGNYKNCSEQFEEESDEPVNSENSEEKEKENKEEKNKEEKEKNQKKKKPFADEDFLRAPSYAWIYALKRDSNVNKAITGVKDPHIRISPGAAASAGCAGQVLNVVNKVAPILTVASVAYEAYQVKECVGKDIENGSSRNTIQKVATTATTAAGGLTGSTVGAAIGTFIFPVFGTMIGGLVGGVIGGFGGAVGGGNASEAILDTLNYDIDYIICKKCQREFQHRRYQEGHAQKLCPNCR